MTDAACSAVINLERKWNKERINENKSSGGKCEACKFKGVEASAYHVECTLKRNKKVNKLAICEHFKWPKS